VERYDGIKQYVMHSDLIIRHNLILVRVVYLDEAGLGNLLTSTNGQVHAQ